MIGSVRPRCSPGRPATAGDARLFRFGQGAGILCASIMKQSHLHRRLTVLVVGCGGTASQRIRSLGSRGRVDRSAHDHWLRRRRDSPSVNRDCKAPRPHRPSQPCRAADGYCGRKMSLEPRRRGSTRRRTPASEQLRCNLLAAYAVDDLGEHAGSVAAHPAGVL